MKFLHAVPSLFCLAMPGSFLSFAHTFVHLSVANLFLRPRPTIALPPSLAPRPRPPRPPGHHTLARRPTHTQAKWKTKNDPLFWHFDARPNLTLEKIVLVFFQWADCKLSMTETMASYVTLTCVKIEADFVLCSMDEYNES